MHPAPAAAPPLTIFTARRIHTMDPEQPQVQALLLDEQGRISDRGDLDALKSAHPQARVVDLGKRTVVPGLIDAHGQWTRCCSRRIALRQIMGKKRDPASAGRGTDGIERPWIHRQEAIDQDNRIPRP